MCTGIHISTLVGMPDLPKWIIVAMINIASATNIYNRQQYILSVSSPFADRVGLPLHNIIIYLSYNQQNHTPLHPTQVHATSHIIVQNIHFVE